MGTGAHAHTPFTEAYKVDVAHLWHLPKCCGKQDSHRALRGMLWDLSPGCRDTETLKHRPGAQFQETLLVCSFAHTTLEGRKVLYVDGNPCLGVCSGFESPASWSGLRSFLSKERLFPCMLDSPFVAAYAVRFWLIRQHGALGLWEGNQQIQVKLESSCRLEPQKAT